MRQIVFSYLLLDISVSLSAQQQKSQYPEGIEHAIVIGVDGLSPDGIRNANTHAGHDQGHGTLEYYKAVSKADSLIGEVLKGITKAGIEKKTLIIVTADHGGVGYGHGGPSIEETEIAMVLFGKGIKKGYQIPEQAITYDLAATIAFALKIVPPYV